MVSLKPGVRIIGFRPETLLALVVADGLWSKQGLDLVVTSVTEGVHMRGSKHYTGSAFDIRTSNTKGQEQTLTKKLADALGPDFDVILEKNHVHVEWDPKTAY